MKNKLFIVILIIAVIPLIYLGLVYNSLPPQVATHFSLDGKPDDYRGKSTLILVIGFMQLITIGMYLLLSNINRIDPKKAANQSKETMQKMAIAIVVLLSSIAVRIIYSAVNNGFSLNKVMLPMLGLFFAYLGNLMHSVKPNYFVGIRTPWALEDEDTWRKTHQLAGKLWFAGGIVITVITLIVPANSALIVMISIVAIITIIPTVYSYRYYQLHKK
ncbi:SdpI family protein [Segetibacter aerophilus]|uniref:Immunity protein SdpI n=1 Tax=Segetibacter aerophilus TaxID=670293 RepID=A0A512BBQ5_9BACT|nr:SdpI family protein [Segetibacter aerophilus]GEO09411.1 immunity protein SdpI [Segetibacter aerophilus]